MQNIIVTNQVLNEKHRIKTQYENQYALISDMLHIHDTLCIHYPDYAQIANNVLCSSDITFEETRKKLFYVYEMWVKNVLKIKDRLWIYKSNNNNFEFFLFNDNSPTEMHLINLELISSFKFKNTIFVKLARLFGWSDIENNFFLNHLFWMIPEKKDKKSIIKASRGEYLNMRDCDPFVFDVMMEIRHNTSNFLQESRVIEDDKKVEKFLQQKNPTSKLEQHILSLILNQSEYCFDIKSFYQIYDNVLSDKSYGLATIFSRDFNVDPFFAFEQENTPVSEYSNIIPLFITKKEELEIIQEFLDQDDQYFSEMYGMTPIETKYYSFDLKSSQKQIIDFASAVRSRENTITKILNALTMVH